MALSEATKDVVYVRKLLSGLGIDVSEPTDLGTDSKSARDVAYNPEQHSRMKHVLRRHFFVRDMVEAFEITVPFVRSEDNPADFLTKPMKNPDAFFKWRQVIMNETERGDASYRRPARGGSSDSAPRATDDKYQAAERAQPRAAAAVASQVEPAPRTGTLVRGGASESEGPSACLMYNACDVTCSCCTSPFSLTRDRR